MVSAAAQARSLMTRWSVDIIGKHFQHPGTVLAENERKALEEAIKQFAIRPALRSKIVVTKVVDNA
jgi:1,2-phenylacetyl-CoA epoxidase PaaB subunit